MQNTTFHTTSLLKMSDDTAFIIQCYHVMLGRSLDPFKMQHAIEVLSKGMSRKDSVCWIACSPEFGSRFFMEGIAPYKLDCYLYKDMEKLFKLLHLDIISTYSNDSFSISLRYGRSGFLAGQFIEHDYSFDIGYSALAEGQIPQIPTCLPKLTPSTCIGHLTSVLDSTNPILNIGVAHIRGKEMMKQVEFPLSAPKNGCSITNLDILFNLLTTDKLSFFTNSIEDTFVLTTPQLFPSQTYINIVWDRSWNRLEFHPDGTPCRWMLGPELNGSIYLISHNMDYRQITLSFTLTVPDIDSEVSIFPHGKTVPIKCSNTGREVTLRLSLNPGCNTITFHCVGRKLKLSGTSGRPVLLSVDNLVLSFTDSSYQPLLGESAYSMDEQSHGTGYYPYLLPDSFIRSQLHRNGFFEISAYRISRTYAVIQLPVTRYDYLRDERNHGCFYILNAGGKREDESSFSSVIVYTTRRTGRLSPEFYNYELGEH